jgi:ribosomal protein S18 acetylase RimI-like enzyme
VTLLSTLETYYDAAPRPMATTEEVGPFTLFRQSAAGGWPLYARPTLDNESPVSRAQVEAVRRRQRELGLPENLEWVHETTPSLLAAAREAGLHVAECPLLVLPDGVEALAPPLPDRYDVRMLDADSPGLGAAVAAVNAGFAGTDDVRPVEPEPFATLLRSCALAMAGAYDDQGAVGGGSHALRGETTELTGIAVIPRARRQGVGATITALLVADARAGGARTVFLSAQDDAVARVYERLGFQRIGTACVAEPPESASHA